jgi:diguanylate cyclase (GGDEF)-like protein
LPLLPLRPGSAVLCVAAFIGVHALCIVAFPAHSPALSYACMLLAALAATIGAWRWTRRSSARLRMCSALVASGLTLWMGSLVLDMWDGLVKHDPATVALWPDLVYFFYGVPILFAISLSTAEQRTRLFLWLYGLQAAVIAYLAYIILFSGAPFTGEPAAPISEFRVSEAFLAENIVLALAVTVRLIACYDAEERRFFRILTGFLYMYLGCSTIYNFLAQNPGPNLASLFDCIIDVPFLVLALWYVYAPKYAPKGDPELAKMAPAVLFISSASPILFTYGMLALGTVVMQRHFLIGSCAVAVALGCYGLQATLLQTRYVRSQQSLSEALDRLQDLSMTDGLTGIPNRRCFDQTLDRELNRAKRSGHVVSLLMIDIDFFKNLNDRYGHVYGDECLAAVAKTLRAGLPRDADVLARYGGEEFAAILPETDRIGAETVAAKMRSAVRRLAIRNQTAIGDIATISIGISTYAPDGEASCVDLIKGSDHALYRAKRDGRDRVEFFAGV